MPRLSQLCAALLLGICMASERAEPAQPVLTITAGADTKHFTAAELLSRAGLSSLGIPPNVDSKGSLTRSSSAVARFARGHPAQRARPA
jgi:hypothetical protein